jgi:hypothetical protein
LRWTGADRRGSSATDRGALALVGLAKPANALIAADSGTSILRVLGYVAIQVPPSLD